MRLWLIAAASWIGLGTISDIPAADSPVWNKDYTAANKIALRTGKPLLVVFR